MENIPAGDEFWRKRHYALNWDETKTDNQDVADDPLIVALDDFNTSLEDYGEALAMFVPEVEGDDDEDEDEDDDERDDDFEDDDEDEDAPDFDDDTVIAKKVEYLDSQYKRMVNKMAVCVLSILDKTSSEKHADLKEERINLVMGLFLTADNVHAELMADINDNDFHPYSPEELREQISDDYSPKSPRRFASKVVSRFAFDFYEDIEPLLKADQTNELE